MCLSIPKCKALNISRKKIPTKQEYYHNGSPLATVSEIKDLGITFTNTLQRSQHIKQISAKENRPLGLIRRVCRDINDPDIKKLLYCSIVWPQLEYACELWSPYTSKDKQTVCNYCSKTFSTGPQSLYWIIQGICPIGITCLNFLYYRYH